jgi:hypothetical protein
MNDRLDIVEERFREEIKEMRKDITDIKVSVKAIETKVNGGVNIFKEVSRWAVMVIIAIISGLIGTKFGK